MENNEVAQLNIEGNEEGLKRTMGFYCSIHCDGYGDRSWSFL